MPATGLRPVAAHQEGSNFNRRNGGPNSTGLDIGLGFSGINNFVLSGTWSIVGGTGRYAGLKGGGAFVATMLHTTTGPDEFDFSYRYEGFVTRS